MGVITGPRLRHRTGQGVGIDDQFDLRASPTRTGPVVIGVEERTHLHQSIRATPDTVTGVVLAVPGRRGTDRLQELDRAGVIEHEPPHQTINSTCGA